MSNLSRRKLITSGLAATAGASSLAVAASLAKRDGLIPPDHGGIYGAGETLTYAAQRMLTRHSLAREFPRSQISKTPFPNGEPPNDEAYRHLQEGAFADWRLAVDGMVARLASFSLAELKSHPSRSQITHLACEEGWSLLLNGSACLYSTSWTSWGFSRKLNMLSTSRYSPASGTALIWLMHCILRLW